MLIGQSRFQMAEEELRQGLLAEPEDGDGHALLALCLTEQEKYQEATREAQISIHHAPDVALSHYVLARVFLARNRCDEALQSADEAIRIDPESADLHALKAAIHLELRDWQPALDAAMAGLALEPENVECANLRAMALVKLGRKGEARAMLDETLAKAPEDDMAHANKAWTLLHQGLPQPAMEHFREALRLNPENEWARGGMIEALKARHTLYRWLLAYFLWMSSLSRRAQWGVILGLYFVPKALRGVASANPELKMVIYPLVGLMALFVLMTWIADPLFNLLLRLNRFGRYALSRSQLMASNALLGCLVGAAGSMLLGYLAGEWRWYLAGFAFLLMMIPVSGTFNMQAGWPRKLLTVYTGVLVLCAVFGIAVGVAGEERARTPLESAAFACLVVWLFGVAAFGWIANGLAMARVRR